ncbi:MAG: glycosyltransferase [Candidatus Hydrogenedentes bacterium]|nr:glycosyltransferase [Candidatus Hydrogenedentota bacterium]
MRALIVSPLFPCPLLSGGHTRVSNLLREMGRRHELNLVSLITPEQLEFAGTLEGLQAPPELAVARRNYELREKVREAASPEQWRRTVRRYTDRLRGVPREVMRHYFPEMAGKLKQTLRRGTYEVVQLEYTAMGWYLPVVRRLAPRARVVLEEIDISYIAMQRLLDSGNGLPVNGLVREVTRMERYERDLWKRCGAVVTMSEIDRRHIGRFVPLDKVWTVPNGVDVEHFVFQPRPTQTQSILFLGYFEHLPNVAGLRYFFRDIWPEVRRRCPSSRLEVVGKSAPEDIRAMHGRDGISVHGFVPDVRPLMQTCRLMVVPILSGGGTRLKVLEAFAAGLPVVSTTIGCEGIEIEDGVNVCLADTSAKFADAVTRLFDDHVRAQAMAERARRLVAQKYSWRAIAREWEKVWTDDRRN